MRFPRHMFKRRKLVKSIDEFTYLINQYNGKKDCYLSLYAFDIVGGHVSYDNSIIDKIFFDFDSKQGLESVRVFHTYLMSKDIKHKIYFSGRGFHVYTLTNKVYVKNPKSAIASAQQTLAKEAGLSIGDPKIADMDNHIVGDIARISRFPNTVNLKSKLYCIPLKHSDLDLQIGDIRELAKAPQHSYEVFGKQLLDLSAFDSETPKIYLPEAELKDTGNISEDFPPCIKYLLSKQDCAWKDRYYVILYLRDIGLTKTEIDAILKKYLTQDKFRHAVYDERQTEYLCGKRHEYFLSKSHFHEHGCCFNCKDCPIEKLYK